MKIMRYAQLSEVLTITTNLKNKNRNNSLVEVFTEFFAVQGSREQPFLGNSSGEN